MEPVIERTRPAGARRKGAAPAGREGPGPEIAAPGVKVPELAGSLSAAVGEYAGPAPCVPADATIEDAARAMRDADASAALVGRPRPTGIVTDSDLRGRVVAEGVDPTTPARQVMSRPLRTLDARTPLYGALLMMLEEDVHHVPVVRDGEVVGVVSERDLLRRQVRAPLMLLGSIESIDSPDALEGYAEGIAATAESLLAGGLEPVRIARVIASLNDALTRRLVHLAEAELGEPPCDYAWLALGSEGRMEQVLLSDQDNALAFADASEEARRYFEALAERVVGGLLRAGFPPCPGGYMATNWSLSLDEWRRRFGGWVAVPGPQALLEAEVFLDFRPVSGELSLAPLDEALLEGGRRPLFLAQFARVATKFAPPVGRLGRIRSIGGQVDLKRGGIAAIVLLARLHALAAGSTARSTLERLRHAAAGGALSTQASDELADAFRLLMRIRLREQLRMRAAGRAPEDRVPLGDLSPLERRWLRDALQTVALAQRSVAARFHTESIA
jgi:CBS domain-containing protein